MLNCGAEFNLSQDLCLLFWKRIVSFFGAKIRKCFSIFVFFNLTKGNVRNTGIKNKELERLTLP